VAAWNLAVAVRLLHRLLRQSSDTQVHGAGYESVAELYASHAGVALLWRGSEQAVRLSPQSGVPGGEAVSAIIMAGRLSGGGQAAHINGRQVPPPGEIHLSPGLGQAEGGGGAEVGERGGGSFRRARW